MLFVAGKKLGLKNLYIAGSRTAVPPTASRIASEKTGHRQQSHKKLRLTGGRYPTRPRLSCRSTMQADALGFRQTGIPVRPSYQVFGRSYQANASQGLYITAKPDQSRRFWRDLHSWRCGHHNGLHIKAVVSRWYNPTGFPQADRQW